MCILSAMRRLAAVLVVVALALAGCSVVSVDLTPRIKPLEEETVEGRGGAKVLLTDISGFISDDPPSSGLGLGPSTPRVPLLVRLREELKKAAEDKDVRALVLRLNTPGGTVTASDILYRELMLFRERSKVPVIAVLMDVAASGGYYIALAADTIVAHPTTVTGSSAPSWSRPRRGPHAEDRRRRQHHQVRRAQGHGQPLPPAHARGAAHLPVGDRRAAAQSWPSRGAAADPDDAARTLADGRIYTAPQALGHRLVDAIGYVPDAIEAAKRAAGLSEAKVIVYKRPREYRATYYAQARTEASAFDAVAQLAASAGIGPKFLDLWAP